MNDMKSSIYSSVTGAVASARRAYGRHIKLILGGQQEALEGVKKAFRPLANELAVTTVAETGMGVVQGRVQKIKFAVEKMPGAEGLITKVNTGDHGITFYELSSFGIICAVQPCTNPYTTPISNTIGMLVVRNAIIHCPHPRVAKVSRPLTTIISETIRSISGIDNLVATLRESLMGFTIEVMSHPDVDLVVRTGDSGFLRQAMTSGKEMIEVESANPVTIMGATVNLEKAAGDIVRDAPSDNDLTCTSEKYMIVGGSVLNRLIYELLKNGVYYIRNEAEIQKLLNVAVIENFMINKKLGGRSAKKIPECTGIPVSEVIKLAMAETGQIHPFVIAELMMSLVPSIKMVDFDEALEIALEVEQGYKHAAVIHSESTEHLNRAARELQTSVFVKNGPSLMGTGFDKEGRTSFTIVTTIGERTTAARHFAHKRRYMLTSGFSIHWL